MLNPNEEGRFKQLLLYVTDNPGSAYALQIGETTVHARFDTCYESDNGMEMDERGTKSIGAPLFKTFAAENCLRSVITTFPSRYGME